MLENLGLPLTMRTHENIHLSFLSSTEEEVSLRGLVNVLILLLITYNLRAIVSSLKEHDFILINVFDDIIKSGLMRDPQNYSTGLATILGGLFVWVSYLIEKLAGHRILNNTITNLLVILNMTALLIYPVYVGSLINSHPHAALYMMVLTCGLFMKLTSFHHVMGDNRKLLKRIADSKEKLTPEQGESKYNIPMNQYSIALTYPNHMNVWFYLRFLFAPTCCYQLVYPMTPSINWKIVVKRAFEFLICNFMMIYIIF